MMHPPSYKFFIYTALPCEAKPLVEYFKLKKDMSIQAFTVYFNNEICLTVTGVGKSAMAAGVAFTQALFASVEHPIILNIGVAGHKHEALGRLFFADKIMDVDSERSYYPSLIYTLPVITCGIQTVSKPQASYHPSYLCDMEASAFYETAVRFTSSEFVFCLKVVSDNEMSPSENINPKEVCHLIGAHISSLELVLEQAFEMSAVITNPELVLVEQLMRQHHFTIAEQRQLKSLLTRWYVMTDKQCLDFDEVPFGSAKELLRWLDLKIQATHFCL